MLIFLLLLIPIALSNNPKGAICAIFVFVVLFFFPGYLLLTIMGGLPGGFRTLLSPIFGIVCITTAYDIFARASMPLISLYFVVALSAAGMILVALQARQSPTPSWWTPQRHETVMVGSAVALTVAPLCWRSGRFSAGEFVFYGPAGHDPLFHVTLLQRLCITFRQTTLWFRASGHPSITISTTSRWRSSCACKIHLYLGAMDLFDLYFRCYPILVYFLLGALAYRTR